LLANLYLPVLRIYGSSMSPALNEGDIVPASIIYAFIILSVNKRSSD
jgi:hypothetical protein